MNLVIWVWDGCLDKKTEQFITSRIDGDLPVVLFCAVIAFMFIKVHVILMIIMSEKHLWNKTALSVSWVQTGSSGNRKNWMIEHVCPYKHTHLLEKIRIDVKWDWVQAEVRQRSGMIKKKRYYAIIQYYLGKDSTLCNTFKPHQYLNKRFIRTHTFNTGAEGIC